MILYRNVFNAAENAMLQRLMTDVVENLAATLADYAQCKA